MAFHHPCSVPVILLGLDFLIWSGVDFLREGFLQVKSANRIEASYVGIGRSVVHNYSIAFGLRRVLSSAYDDLNGADEAQQFGLKYYASRSILRFGVMAFLAERGQPVPHRSALQEPLKVAAGQVVSNRFLELDRANPVSSEELQTYSDGVQEFVELVLGVRIPNLAEARAREVRSGIDAIARAGEVRPSLLKAAVACDMDGGADDEVDALFG